jgi:hypothetical protein
MDDHFEIIYTPITDLIVEYQNLQLNMDNDGIINKIFNEDNSKINEMFDEEPIKNPRISKNESRNSQDTRKRTDSIMGQIQESMSRMFNSKK